MKFQNPILPGFYPDPTICRVGEDFFLAASSFEYFPGVPLFTSRDLWHWRQIGHCLNTKSQLDLTGVPASNGIFAPTLRCHDGIFYMITTHNLRGNFFVTARDPAGLWSDPIWVKQKGIDPSLFFDDDGKVFITSQSDGEGSGRGIIQSQVDVVSGRLVTKPVMIWQGTGGRYPEAPHLYKEHGWYYLMIAEGGTEYGHMITLSRSQNPWGPFEACPHNPILSHRDRGQHPIQGTGHGDLVQASDGTWWIVFLGFRPTVEYFHHLGRETFLAPVAWTRDLWPVINNHSCIELEMEAPELPPCPFALPPVRDDFDAPSLSPLWVSLREPREKSASLSARKGYLTLFGTSASLEDTAAPAFIGRRQQHFNCRVQASLEFLPSNNNEEAGLTVYYSPQNHYEIGLTSSDGQHTIFVRRRIGDLQAIVAQTPAPVSKIELIIDADSEYYHFGFKLPEQKPHFLASGRTWYVSTEATRCSFTGVVLAMYATGHGQPVMHPAYFDWFEYQPLDDARFAGSDALKIDT